MHKSVIRNHRGQCQIFYENLENTKKLVRNDNPNILIIDKLIASLYPELIEEFSNIKEIIHLNSGEKTKTLDEVVSLLKKIDNLNIYPINNALVIGGATIQDTVGTALALLKRGTNWNYIPTTLLSQADSCIGSKTSINSPNAKNIYGVFYSPNKIFILNEFLETLPDKEIISGIGDAMHYLFLDINSNYFYIMDLVNSILVSTPNQFIKKKGLVKNLCKKCHEIKRYYIEKDEFDQKERKVLNLGHSFGHALESFLDFEIPHGIAVLFGLIFASDISEALYSRSFSDKFKNNLQNIKIEIFKLLEIYSPLKPKKVYLKLKNNPYDFLDILSKDKKNKAKGKYNLILYKNDLPLLEECEDKIILDYLKVFN